MGGGQRTVGGVRAPRASPRLPALAVVAVVLAAGLSIRAATGGAVAKYGGVALYGALVYAIVVCVAPRVPPGVAGATALALCWAIEFAQLTPVPAALSARSGVARLVLGSTFNPPDLAWYAAGVALLLGVHWTATRRRAASP
ncbi:MAG: hypothetical protein V7637_4788 [Mycobacteriales bacterium]|jgi:hypothetical protein